MTPLQPGSSIPPPSIISGKMEIIINQFETTGLPENLNFTLSIDFINSINICIHMTSITQKLGLFGIHCLKKYFNDIFEYVLLEYMIENIVGPNALKD